MISELGGDNSLPWLIGGEFNEILFAEEKVGGVRVDFNSLNAFRSCLEVNDLDDLGAEGYKFTWSNKRSEGFIEERLDRCVGNTVWRHFFDNISVENVIWDDSDDFPIVLRTRRDGLQSLSSLNENKPFRFEAKWIDNESFIDILLNCWQKSKAKYGDHWIRVVEECGARLKASSHEAYINSSKRIWWLKKRLVWVRKMVQTPAVVEEPRQGEADIRKIRLDFETSAWQRCCPFVLQDGDKNTAYFHSKMAARKKRNRLKGLKDSTGTLQTSPEGMCQVVINYFEDLFSSSRPPISVGQLDMIDNQVSESHDRFFV